MIEDVVTTGGQLKESIRDLRSSGAIITDALCVIMRGPKEEIKKTFKDVGTLFPKIDTIIKTKAISVAVGIAQPLSAISSLKLKEIKNKAGKSIPPKAAIAGSAIFDKEDRCPINNSLLISRPIRRKNIDIKPSFIHKIRGLSIESKEHQ